MTIFFHYYRYDTVFELRAFRTRFFGTNALNDTKIKR
jgi:hypothetical protein